MKFAQAEPDAPQVYCVEHPLAAIGYQAVENVVGWLDLRRSPCPRLSPSSTVLRWATRTSMYCLNMYASRETVLPELWQRQLLIRLFNLFEKNGYRGEAGFLRVLSQVNLLSKLCFVRVSSVG